MNFLKKKWPLLLIVVLWFVFSSPYFLAGKVPFPSTYLASNFGPWSDYINYAGFVKNTATPDVITQIYPWKKIVVESLKNGVIPFWNSYIFSGTPLLANYQAAALSPFNLLYFIFPFIDAWSIQILLAPLLAGIFTYFFARSLKISEAGSVICGIAFMFCGFITTWMVYGTLPYAILFLPLALYSIQRFFDSRKWYYSLILSLSIPLSFFSGHFQTSTYCLLFIIYYLLFKVVSEKNLGIFVLTSFSVLFGILISAPQLLPSIEFYLNSVRSELFIKTEVIPWVYLPTLLAPDIFGNPVTRNAWFGHYAEWNAYVGVVPLILAVFGAFRRNKYFIFFTVSAIFSLFLAFQTPLLDLLIASKIPVLSTSAASRIIVLFSFSVAILAGLGFDNLQFKITKGDYKKIVHLSFVFGIIFAVLWGVVLFKLFLSSEQLLIAKSNLILPTIIFGFFLVLVIIPTLVKNKKAIVLSSALIILLVAFDLIRFSSKWQPFESRTLIYPDVPVSKFLKTISSQDRSFGNFGQEMSMALRTPGVEGYDPLYIGRYGEFLNAGVDGHYHQAYRSVALLSKNGQYTGQILNLLGVKYIIHKISDGHAIWAFPFWTYPTDQFRTVYQDDKYRILINDKSMPRAFVVGSFKVERDKRNILSDLFRRDLDLSKIAVVEEKPNIAIAQGASGSAVIKRYDSNNVMLKVQSSGNSVLILSDPYYPGWKALVDGRETKIFRADYAFRAIALPAGKHTVTFTYDPDSFKIGLLAALTGVIGVLSLSLYIWRRFR